MRHLLTSAAALALAGVVTAASPAQAQCRGTSGTVPGSGPTVIALGAHPHVVYVDDRDLNFLTDPEHDAGGLWIYLESNGREGLQRSLRNGVNKALHDHGIHFHLPRVGPIQVGPMTLFPLDGTCGWGQPYCDPVESIFIDDWCGAQSGGDTLLF